MSPPTGVYRGVTVARQHCFSVSSEVDQANRAPRTRIWVFEQMEPKFDKMVVDSIQGALPVRVGSMNLCYPPPFFRIAWAIVSPFLTKCVRLCEAVVAEGREGDEIVRPFE